jgi:hypothetical protein
VDHAGPSFEGACITGLDRSRSDQSGRSVCADHAGPSFEGACITGLDRSRRAVTEGVEGGRARCSCRVRADHACFAQAVPLQDAETEVPVARRVRANDSCSSISRSSPRLPQVFPAGSVRTTTSGITGHCQLQVTDQAAGCFARAWAPARGWRGSRRRWYFSGWRGSPSG